MASVVFSLICNHLQHKQTFGQLKQTTNRERTTVPKTKKAEGPNTDEKRAVNNDQGFEIHF